MTIDPAQSLFDAPLPAFDRAFFVRLYKPDQYGTAFACEMIELFITTTSALLATLDTALDAHDLGRAERLLHQVKGSAASIGGAALVQLCSSLEEQSATLPLARRDV
jgi:HPt (histidine-containing phosphotransfer) domain-containing protein